MNNIINFNTSNNTSTNNIIIAKNDILIDLIKNQVSVSDINKKLSLTDLKRIVTNLPINIFSNECCIWSGYIINSSNIDKNCYISFFIKNKKKALHRLLYCNFIGDLSDNEYLKFTCNNKGKCCTISHFYKIHNLETKVTEPPKITSQDTAQANPNKNKVFF